MSEKTEKKGKPKGHKVGETRIRTLRNEFVIHIPDITISEPGRYHVTAKLTEVHYTRKQ